MNRRPKHCCQSCATGVGGVCDAPVGHGTHQALEPWWSPRSGPDPATMQAAVASSTAIGRLVGDRGRAVVGLQGRPVTFFVGDSVSRQFGIVRPRLARSVPPAQTTLITPRWSTPVE